MPKPRPSDLDHHALNALLNIYDEHGNIQFDADREAVDVYLRDHVHPNTVTFPTLEEKLQYLIDENYYEREVFDQYRPDFVKQLYRQAYGHNFRFPTFVAAYKYYNSYTLKTNDGTRYLETFEDRVVAVALTLARGQEDLAQSLVDDILLGRFQPATPTFLNAGRAQRGELVSCYLLRTEDNMESISRNITNALQLSKRGGGVAICLTNLREQGAPIKGVENQSSGVVPVMKLLEDSFSYSNQLGQRPGAGAVYLQAHHPDIMTFLDTKRENADEKIRIKTLSLGVVIPDITFDLARKNEDMLLFSPHDVEREYGVPFSDISVTEMYDELADNPRIRKKAISTRRFFQTLAELQFESGYPYILFEDTANRDSQLKGRITHSNLCVTGDTNILTSNGYRNVRELYETQEDFDVVVDTRARDMDLSKVGTSVEKSTRMFLTAEQADVYKVTTADGFELRATEWHKMYVERDGHLLKIPLGEVRIGDRLLVATPDRKVCRQDYADTLHHPLLYGHRQADLPNTDELRLLHMEAASRGVQTRLTSHQQRRDSDAPPLLESKSERGFTSVVSIEPDGTEDVYDVTVENGNSVIFNGLATGNCSEILQVSTASTFKEDGSYDEPGNDISCNLGSLNIARAMDSGDLGQVVETAVRALTTVSDMSNIECAPSVQAGNRATHAIGLGQMNLHGYLGREGIHYGSEEALEFVSAYFAAVAYYAVKASNRIARERGETFDSFETSRYASGEYFEKYVTKDWRPTSKRVKALFNFELPTREDWAVLREAVMEYGLYNGYLQAVPPTGSISYVNHATSSIHPIVAQIEVRKESQIGRVYVPQYGLTNENREFYTDAYDLGPEAVIDTYAAAQEHVDQGLSCTLFFKDTATTRDINRAQIYAWRKGLKTLYYVRIRQDALDGMSEDACVSCTL